MKRIVSLVSRRSATIVWQLGCGCGSAVYVAWRRWRGGRKATVGKMWRVDYAGVTDMCGVHADSLVVRGLACERLESAWFGLLDCVVTAGNYLLPLYKYTSSNKQPTLFLYMHPRCLLLQC